MSKSVPHASTSDLDRMRAGLPVDRHTRAHVEECLPCQATMLQWQHQAAAIREFPLNAGLRNRLRAARIQALNGTRRSRPSRWRLAAAAAGVFGVSLALGLWLAPQQTLTPLDAHADFYSDVDFYLWLETRESTPGS